MRDVSTFHRKAASGRPIVLEAKGVWKAFGHNAETFKERSIAERSPEALAAANLVGAVQNASFGIAKGEVFVIMGLSGSGKSTLLRCLTRLIEPSDGSVLYDGNDITTLHRKDLAELRKNRMGMVFQHFALLPNRTVLGNIAFPLEIQGMDRGRAMARAEELAAVVGLEGREHRFPAELSGGQQQRVGIARSLATDPDFWFLDEPFSALDPLIRTELQTEVLRLQKEHQRTSVFVTHDLDEAIKLADRIAIMEGGRIVQIGTAEDLVMNPADAYVRKFVAKISPSKVVRVSSLMTEAIDPTAGRMVAANSTISELTGAIVEGEGDFSVMDEAGKPIGLLKRADAIEVLIRSS